MNLGYAHTMVAGLAIIVAGACAALHAISGSECQTIIIGSLGSLSGHAVGYAHGVQTSIREATDRPRVLAAALQEASKEAPDNGS